MRTRVGVAFVAIGVALACSISGCGSTTTTTTNAQGGTVSVAVSSPTSGTVIAGSSVTVRGTVSPPNASVLVQGRPAAVGNGVFTAEASLHGGKTTIDVIGSADGETPGSTSISITQQSSASSGGSAHGSNATPAVAHESAGEASTGQTACGGGLSVGPDTTCDFAANVKASYEQSGPGTYQVYSPVTEKTYSMTCSSGTPVVCTGANNASVYFP